MVTFLGLFAALAEEPIAQGHQDTQTVNQRHAGKGELGVEGIYETYGEGTDDAAQRFGGVIEAHDQIFLGRLCLISHHALQHRNTDGITGIDQNAADDEQPKIRYQQGTDGGERAYRNQHRQRQGAEGFADDPDAQGGVEHEGDHTHGGLDDTVVGRGQRKLILQIVIESLVKAGVGKVHQGAQQKQQHKARVHKILAVQERLQGIGLNQQLLGRGLFTGLRIVLAYQQEGNAGNAQRGTLNPEGKLYGKFTDKAANEITECAGHSVDNGADGEIFALVLRLGDVHNIGQHTHKDTANENARQKPENQHGQLCGGTCEAQLSQTVANTADAQRPAGGNVQIDLAPERGEQEIRGHHGGQSQAEHIVMET